MGLINWLRKRRDRMKRWSAVTLDDDGVTCRSWNGFVQMIRWADLMSITVETTACGPLLDDVFWLLADRESIVVVPSEAHGAEAMIKRLQQLPGFNNDALTDAIRCTDNRRFLCWTRDESECR